MPVTLKLFRDLPYAKTDSVAELDAPRPPRPPRPLPKPSPAVPARSCLLARTCSLRRDGRCESLHCTIAMQYVAYLEGER